MDVVAELQRVADGLRGKIASNRDLRDYLFDYWKDVEQSVRVDAGYYDGVGDVGRIMPEKNQLQAWLEVQGIDVLETGNRYFFRVLMTLDVVRGSMSIHGWYYETAREIAEIKRRVPVTDSTDKIGEVVVKLLLDLVMKSGR